MLVSFWESLFEQVRAISLLELLAVVLAIAYLLLVIRQNIWCWACAGISSAIYVWLFVEARLYMESLLYLFYVAMAIYGWRVWFHARNESELSVSSWSSRIHALAMLIIVAMAAVSGWLLLQYSNAVYPFTDSLTTFAAIWASFLVARKVFENWWYWLVIDIVSIFIYWSRGLELTALLFVFYVALIPVGMRQWRLSVDKVVATG
jgi:nicotinamide mononucleotide transporter